MWGAMYRELLSALAIALTFVAFYSYIRSILQGETKPHVISWVIWGVVTFVVFFAQLADGGGVGAWPIGISGLITLYIALLAYLKKSDKQVTKTDLLFFTLAMLSMPLWYFTSEPLWAVVILTVVDLLGFGPTLRKGYNHPFDEQLTLFVIMFVRNAMVIVALENYSMTTILFPAASGLACLSVVLLVLVRRRLVLV